jgi:glycosyltransferase involved in cell wall biosynthesis
MDNALVYSKPKLSVVVASQNANRSVRDCLRALENKRNGSTIEIVVVDNSVDGTAEIVRREFPEARLIVADPGKLIPELWGIGISESTGDYLALTTTHFVPSRTWTSEILKAHQRPHSGVGGAIENDADAGVVSWAIYFCRYSPYMLPFAESGVDDFAADNASYKRSDLERVSSSMADGFWETFVHREMLKEGMSLLKLPDIVVYHQNSFSFSGFMIQRYWHGRQFGAQRAGHVSKAKRTALVMASPLIPLLYLFRITRRVFARKRNIGKLVAAFPILSLFLLSWSLGEFSGYLWRSDESRS